MYLRTKRPRIRVAADFDKMRVGRRCREEGELWGEGRGGWLCAVNPGLIYSQGYVVKINPLQRSFLFLSDALSL